MQITTGTTLNLNQEFSAEWESLHSPAEKVLGSYCKQLTILRLAEISPNNAYPGAKEFIIRFCLM
jgi:hypothetical protein